MGGIIKEKSTKFNKLYPIKILLFFFIFSIMALCFGIIWKTFDSKIKSEEMSIKASGEFEISTPEEWNSYAKEIAANSDKYYTTISDSSRLFTFKLTADLDFTGKTFIPLGAKISGTNYQGNTDFFHILDGDDHTIQNITLTIDSCSSGDPYLGIISVMRQGSHVKNLHIKNFTINYNNKKEALIGAVCGKVDTTDDAFETRYTDNWASKMNFVFVENFKVVLGENVNDGTTDGTHIGALYADYVYQDMVSVGAARGSLEIRWISIYGFDVIEPDRARYINVIRPCNAVYVRFQWVFEGYVILSDMSIKYSVELKTRYLYSVKNTTITNITYEPYSPSESFSLLASSDAGPSSDLWYYYEGYWEGYALLRKFIDWETLEFVIEDNAIASISQSNGVIYVPSDVILSDKTGKTISILGQTATANLKTDFTATIYKWTYDNAFCYYVRSNGSALNVHLSFSYRIQNLGIKCEGEYSHDVDTNGELRTFDSWEIYGNDWDKDGFDSYKDEAVFILKKDDLINVDIEYYEQQSQAVVVGPGVKQSVSIFKAITFEFNYFDQGGDGYMKIRFYLPEDQIQQLDGASGDQYAMYCGYPENSKIVEQVKGDFILSSDKSTRVSGHSIELRVVKKSYNITIS